MRTLARSAQVVVNQICLKALKIGQLLPNFMADNHAYITASS
jgi:hypothetical protein